MFSTKHNLLNTTVVLYHAQCTDGFGAAFAAWSVLKDKARYIPVKHGQSYPENMDGEHVLILDFCYPREITKSLQDVAASVTVIDHHATGFKECRDLPDVHFDMRYSGAVLAWKQFNPTKPIPLLFEAIQDCDLETFTLATTRPIILALRQRALDFEVWDELVTKESATWALLNEGMLLDTVLKNSANIIARTASPVRLEGVTGLSASTSWEFAAEAALEMAKRSGTFGLAWYHEGKSVRCSWRAAPGVDVEQMAGMFGGGGHAHSAGSTHPEKDFWKLLEFMREAAEQDNLRCG